MIDNWFEVDRAGLKQLLERRGKGFAVCELVQNAWDQAVTRVGIEIGRPRAGASRLRVTDNDPGGFRDLREAYTLFAPSNAKKANPLRRGRFNLGEKLVLAICRSAEISSTTGTLAFAGKRRRFRSSQRTAAGTVFTAEIPLTAGEYEAMIGTIRSLLPPAGIETSLNGEVIPARPLVRSVEATLPTEISDGAGDLRAAATCAQNQGIYREMCELEITSTFSFQSSWLSDVAPHLLTPDQVARLDRAKEIAKARAVLEQRIPKRLEFMKGWPTFVPTLAEAELLAGVRQEMGVLLGIEVKYTTADSVRARYAELMAEKRGADSSAVVVPPVSPAEMQYELALA
jgi:hypothetical protein